MKISVIIPTYNRARLLTHAVTSLPIGMPTEIIIVDDGSTDNTPEVVRKLSEKDKRIVFLKFDRNQGVNVARNAGIKKATGDWICFLDSDDQYAANGFEVVYKTLDTLEKDIDVVGFMTSRQVQGHVANGGFRVGEPWDTYHPSYTEILSKEGVRGDIHYCFRKTLFNAGYEFPEYVNGFERALPAKIAKDGKKFLYINKVVYLALDGGDVHLSAEPQKRWPRQFARAYKEFVAEHKAVLSQRPYVHILREFYLRIGKGMLRSYNLLGIWWLIKAFCVS